MGVVAARDENLDHVRSLVYELLQHPGNLGPAFPWDLVDSIDANVRRVPVEDGENEFDAVIQAQSGRVSRTNRATQSSIVRGPDVRVDDVGIGILR